METLQFHPQGSIARTQSHFPLFLHIFQKAEQTQTPQVQTSCEELSATGSRQGLIAHSAIASSNVKSNTVSFVNSAYCPPPQHASHGDCPTFSRYGFNLLPVTPFDSFSDGMVDGIQSLAANSTTGDALNPSKEVEDASVCSHFVLREAMDEYDSFNSSNRVESIEITSNDSFRVPSAAIHVDAPLANVVATNEFMAKEGTGNTGSDIPSTGVNDVFAFTTKKVTDSTSYFTFVGAHVDGSDVFAPEIATGGNKVSKLLPHEVVKGEHHHVSTMDDIQSDYTVSMLGDDATNIMHMEEATCDTALSGKDSLGASTAQEISSELSPVGTPMAEHPDAQEEINDTLFDEETKSLSYSPRWHRRLRGSCNTWQFQEETTYGHSTPFVSDSDYGDVINAVLNIAKCLPKNETLQDHLQPFSGRIDHLCGNAILYKLQKERLFLPALSFFDWMRVHIPCLLNSRSLCTMFTILGDANMESRALVLYNNLKHWKELWCVQVFNALLSALSKHRRYDEALSIFQEMSNMKIQRDGVTFCIMLNLAHKSGSTAKVLWQIFVDMEKQKVFAGHEVFGVLIKAFCQEGLRDEALKLLTMMEGRGLIPNVVIYNTLIGAFAKSGMLEEAEGLILEMKGNGICMTVVTYNILIDAYANARNFEVAEGILQGMLDKGPKPNVHSYTALIAAYGRNIRSEKAASVFLRMRKNGISPNTVAYTALIHAYAEDGWHKKAEFTFESMIREGCIPTVETYTSLLHAFRQAGDLEKVKCIWKRMRLERIIGTRATFNVIMDTCARQGEYAQARNVMYEFTKIGCEPDRSTYNMLINAYTRGGQHCKAPEILQEMQKAGFTPDSYTYTTLIFSFLRVRDFTQAFEYHDKMCRDNQLPDKFTYLKLRAVLDEKYEVRAVRNMRAAIGAQRAQHQVEQGKKIKSFRKKQRGRSSLTLSKCRSDSNFRDTQGRVNTRA